MYVCSINKDKKDNNLCGNWKKKDYPGRSFGEW